MGEFSKEYASKGVAGAGLGLGIAGTALGLLNGGNGWFGGWGGGNCGRGWNNCGCNGGGYGYYNDMAMSEALAQRDAQIARLESKAYSDESDLAIYKYFDGKLEEINRRLCQQEVFNTQTNGTLGVLASQLKDQQALLASITRTAVPESAICDFCSRGCSTCTVRNT